MQKPKLKDVHKIADAIASQVSTPPLMNRSTSFDKSYSRSVESIPTNSKSQMDHWKQMTSIARISRRESRTKRRECCKEKDGELMGRVKRSESEHVWSWGKFGQGFVSPMSSLIVNTSAVKKTTAQDLLTDVDKFKYDTDLSSLTPSIDIENLTNDKCTSERGAGIDYDNIKEEETGVSSLILEDNQSISNVEASMQLLSPLSAVTISMTNNDNNNNTAMKDDKYEGSLFDDPNLLNELSKMPTSVTPKANISNSNALSNNVGSNQNSDTTKLEMDENNMINDISIQLDIENSRYDNSGHNSIDSTRDTKSKKIESIFNTAEQKHEAYKSDFAHRRLVSESDYAKLLFSVQDKLDSKGEPVQLSETERERINMAKELFRAQMLSMRHNHNYGHARHTSYDLKPKLEESAKVTQFKGLQSSTKIIRTAEISESLVDSKLVSGSIYEEILKKQKEEEEEIKSTPRKSTAIFSPQTVEAKQTFQQLEKENHNKPTSTRHKKMDSKIFKDVAGNV